MSSMLYIAQAWNYIDSCIMFWL